MLKKKRSRIVFPREVLLVEIERHCADENCKARTRIGLTKEEARLYDGFECERCELWQADGLSERDIPDWWEELTITGLDTLRAGKTGASDTPETNRAGEGGGVVARLSDAWRRRSSSSGSANSSSGETGEKRSAPEGAPDDVGDEPV
ncbi:MAG TPA: hypothetical protein VGB76_19445 [Pyrinomonadaceae bacterium]|jgi:hypothetical protein